jgi:hypothetical protein
MTASAFNAVIKVRGVKPFVFVGGFRANAPRAGWRKPFPVLVRINGKPANACRTNMIPVGDGSFYLSLHGEIRKASGTTVGDRVRVEIDFDTSYRNGLQHPMPRWFRLGLGRTPQAWEKWIALIPSRKKEILRYFSRLNSPDARARNLGKALVVLSGPTNPLHGPRFCPWPALLNQIGLFYLSR